jgi:hypothetical protein
VSVRRCEEVADLLSEDLEGTLDRAAAADVASHLAGCVECRALRLAMADVTSLLRAPAIEPATDLAERVARASWVAARTPILRAQRKRAWANATATWAGWLTEVPFAVQAVAAALALVVTAGLVMAAGSTPGAPARPRFGQRISDATVYVIERKDRLVEDFGCCASWCPPRSRAASIASTTASTTIAACSSSARRTRRARTRRSRARRI